jgi:hypothetical protein
MIIKDKIENYKKMKLIYLIHKKQQVMDLLAQKENKKKQIIKQVVKNIRLQNI